MGGARVRRAERWVDGSADVAEVGIRTGAIIAGSVPPTPGAITATVPMLRQNWHSVWSCADDVVDVPGSVMCATLENVGAPVASA